MRAMSLRRLFLLITIVCSVVFVSSAQATAPSIPVPPAFMGPVSNYLYPHLHNIVWDATTPNRVFAASPIGGWRSDDGGLTWAPLSDATPNLHYGRLRYDRTSNTMYLYRTNDWRLYRSGDEGMTWQVVSDDLFKQVELVPGLSGALYAVNGDWVIRRSDDGGTSWHVINQPHEGANELLIATATASALSAGKLPSAADTIYALADRHLYISQDSGSTWRQQGAWPADAPPRELAVADDGALVALVASDDLPSVSARALLRSTDGGATWVAAPLPTPRIAVMTLVGAQVWAGSDDGHVWRTVDLARWGEAAGWRETPLVLAQPIALRDDVPYTPAITDIAPGPDGVVLIGTIHGIYRASSPDVPAVLRARGLLPTAALPSNMVERPTDHAVGYFPETGHTLRAPFLDAWKRAGGLHILGFPRTEPFIERNIESGRDMLVQYFERGRLEANPDGTHVALGRLGAELFSAAGQFSAQARQQRGCQFFAQTAHNLCGTFATLWRARGGATTLGYPLNEATAVSTGRSQWFERARLADEGKGAFLCLIGSEELQARGWLP